MAKRHRKGRTAPVKKSRRGRPARKPTPDFHEILGRLSDGMSIVATAARSMAAIEAREGSLAEDEANIGEELITLEHGVRVLRDAYVEMDVALRAVQP